MNKTHNKKGTALVIALMVLVVLSLLAAAFLIMSSFEPESSTNEAIIIKSYYKADALIQDYISKLMHGEDLDNNEYPDLFEQIMFAGRDTVIPANETDPDTLIRLERLEGYVNEDIPFNVRAGYSSKYSIGEANVFSRPVIRDIDKDGTLDILFATDKGNIHRFVYTFGIPENQQDIPQNKQFPKWHLIPYGTNPWIETGSPIYGSVIVDSIDPRPDNTLEILFCNDNGELYCYDGASGTQRWKVTVGNTNDYCWEPGVGHLDRDASKEVAYSSSEGVVIVDTDGTIMDIIEQPKCNPAFTGGDSVGYTNGKVIIADVNGGVGGDLRHEIIFTDGLFVYCMNELSNNWVEYWRYPVGIKMDESTGNPLRDGSDNFIPVELKSSPLWVAQPAAYDLDADGDKEILFTAAENVGGANDFCLVVLDDRMRQIDEVKEANFNGVLETDLHVPDDIRCNLWNSYLSGDDFDKIQSYRPIAVQDCNQDGIPDIFVHTNLNKLFLLNVDTEFVSGWTKEHASVTRFDSGDYAAKGWYNFVDYDKSVTGADFPCTSPVPNPINGPAAFVNIDNDIEIEIAYSTMFQDGKSYLIVLDNKLRQTTTYGTYFDTLETYGRFAIYNDENSNNNPSLNGGVSIQDLNNDGFMEMVAASCALDNPPGNALHGSPATRSNQYIFVQSLKNIKLPKCKITAEVKDQSGTYRVVEAIVRVQIDTTNVKEGTTVKESRQYFEIMSWIEK